jgi:spore photoproduct lyase
MTNVSASSAFPPESESATLWTPARVLVTRSAFELPHGAGIVAQCEAAGVTDINVLPGDRLPPLRADDDPAAYALAKRTLAVVIAPPSKRRLAVRTAQRRLAHRPRPGLHAASQPYPSNA